MRYRLTKHVDHAVLPDGDAILISSTGTVTHIDDTGQRFLEAITTGDRDAAVARLSKLFDTSSATITVDLDQFIGDLTRLKILEAS